MYDLFRSAGRDWGVVVNGKAGPSVIEPTVVAKEAGPFTLANGVRITPDKSIDIRTRFDVVCIPEIAVPPEASIAGRFDDEIVWLKKQHTQGALIATACSGAVLAAEAGL